MKKNRFVFSLFVFDPLGPAMAGPLPLCRGEIFLLLFFLVFFLFASDSVHAYCGDGIPEPAHGEVCDDGNFVNRDGCNSYCQPEDMTPPTLIRSYPANGASSVSTDIAYITLTFSEELTPKTVNPDTVQLKQGGVPLSTEVSLKEDGKTAIICPKQPLFAEKKHSIYVSGVVDAVGNIQTEPIIVLFTAGKSVDREPPYVVLSPAPGSYTVAQTLTMKSYLDQRIFDENIDSTAKIYYTLNGLNPTEDSPIYENPISLRSNTTVKYFAEDAAGNKTPVLSARYMFGCPEQANAKRATAYPECKIQECNFGFTLFSNTCVARLDSKSMESDSLTGAVTAPLLPSSSPLVINTKPAIRLTPEHHGILARPILFNDAVRGTTIEFVSGTKITDSSNQPFTGYITPPENLYSKDFPIYFGYTFKSIFSFFPPDKTVLHFDPSYLITLPITEIFRDNEPITVFTYDPALERYTALPDDQVTIDGEHGEIEIISDRSGYFFVAQPATGFNQVYFQDTVGHWAQTYAELLYRKGIAKGKAKGIFAPDDFLTRAEFVKIVLNAINVAPPNESDVEESPFSDVALSAWYTPYIQKAAELNLVNGYPDGKFRPDAPVNRAEAMKMTMIAFKFDLSASDATDVTSRYTDIEKETWYIPYAIFVVNNSLLDAIRDGRTGIPGKFFGPSRNITRAEMAQLTIKAIELRDKTKKQ